VPRLAAPLLAAALLAALLWTGCGGSSSDSTAPASTDRGAPEPTGKAPIGSVAKSCETFSADIESLRATAIPCDRSRQVIYVWQRQRSCGLAAGASRGSCLTRSYRCQAVRVDRGLAVSCSRRPGESIAFLARRRD
jgi:hypothetical protein